MNKRWLKTEWKRAVILLPAIWKRAALLVLILGLAAGMAAFCFAAAGRTQDDSLMRVGYAAPDNALTDMAVSYVQEMESVKALCDIERVTEEEGFRLLQEGALAAFVVLPNDIVKEIISGQNTPVTVYLSAGNASGNGTYGSLKGLLFQELAESAVGMLETAQAEIYAVQYVLGDVFYKDGNLVQTLYDGINRFNLGAAAGREKLFRTKMISATENDTYVIYYGSALLAVYVLLAGIFFGEFFCHGEAWCNIIEKRLHVSRTWQVVCSFLAGLLPMTVTLLLPFMALVLPPVREHLSVTLSLRAVGLLLLAAFFGVLYFMLIYKAFGEKRRALLLIGVSALVQGYLAGCIVPSALLPDLAYGVGKYFPAAFLKAAFTVALSGDVQKLSGAVWGLFVWCTVFFILNIAQTYFMQFRLDRTPVCAVQRRVRFVPSVWFVLLKRVLFRKGIFVSLVLMAVVSVWVARLEAKSDTTVPVAVFDEGGLYEELLSAHDGVVRFILCDSEKEVEARVLRDEAECGYYLPQTLTRDIAAGRANGAVTVYQDVDSVCVPIVNEVLFHALFRHASLAWYQEYLSEFGVDIALTQKAFLEQIALGKTFGIELVRLEESGVTDIVHKARGTYPIAAVVVIAVVLCGVQGLLTALEDCKRGRLYKCGRVRAVFFMTVLPMVAAAVLGSVLLWWL